MPSTPDLLRDTLAADAVPGSLADRLHRLRPRLAAAGGQAFAAALESAVPDGELSALLGPARRLWMARLLGHATGGEFPPDEELAPVARACRSLRRWQVPLERTLHGLGAAAYARHALVLRSVPGGDGALAILRMSGLAHRLACLTASRWSDPAEPAGDDGRAVTVTGVQLALLRAAADGATTSEMAARLNLAPQTVSYHQSQLMHRLDARNRAQLVARAHACGLLP